MVMTEGFEWTMPKLAKPKRRPFSEIAEEGRQCIIEKYGRPLTDEETLEIIEEAKRAAAKQSEQ